MKEIEDTIGRIIELFVNMVLNAAVNGDEESFADYEKSIAMISERAPRLVKPVEKLIHELVGDDDTIDMRSDIARKRFCSYVEAGFSEEQAFKLLMQDRELFWKSITINRKS